MSNKIIRPLSIVILAFTLGILSQLGCSGGVGSSGETYEFSFGTVTNPAAVNLGESVTFSVYYRSQVMNLSDCSIEKSDGTLFSSDEGGVTTNTSTTCTYTAPSTLPSADISPVKSSTISTINVVATIADSSPELKATLTVILSNDTGEVVECTTYADCADTELCYYGRCLGFSEAGVNKDSSCEESADCSDDELCLPLETAEGCAAYCVNMSFFDSSELNPPTNESACNAVEGAVWIDDHEFCLTSDVVACMGDTDESCNGTLAYVECSELTQEQCQNYHVVYGGHSFKYNCVWSDDSGCMLDESKQCDEVESINENIDNAGLGNLSRGAAWEDVPGVYSSSELRDMMACSFDSKSSLTGIIVDGDGNVQFSDGSYYSADELTYDGVSGEYSYSNGADNFILKFVVPYNESRTEINLAFVAGYLNGEPCVNHGSEMVYANYNLGGGSCMGEEGTCSDYSGRYSGDCYEHYENLGGGEYHRCFWQNSTCVPYGTLGEEDKSCSIAR